MNSAALILAARGLGQIASKQLANDESRIRDILSKIASKPLAWLLSFLFSPAITLLSIYTVFNELNKNSPVQLKIRFAMLCLGFVFTSITFIFLTSWLGYFGMAAIFKVTLGWFPLVGYLLGSAFSTTFVIVVQLLCSNCICFLFLQMAKLKIIDEVYREYILQSAQNNFSPNKY